MPSTTRINVRTPGFVHQPPRPPRAPEKIEISTYVVAYPDSPLEPHIKFPFQKRLHEELALRDPVQPFPADPLPIEFPVAAAPGHVHAGVQASPLPPSQETLQREAVRLAAERKERFRQIKADEVNRRDSASPSPSPSPKKAHRVAKGGCFDHSLIEQREYPLPEVVGAHSTFRLRLINWDGTTPRAILAEDGSTVLVLAGRSRDGDWKKEVVEPATSDCDLAKETAQRTSGKADPPPLSGGVGTTFNSDEPTLNWMGAGMVLNAVVFFQLMSTVAMKRLLGFGNRVLEEYCSVAFLALKQQKELFLQHDPRALYPSEASIFSAATVEFGGPPSGQAPGQLNRYDAASWSILHALGKYSATHGGHAIFWDLGLVVTFPTGSTILIPTGIIRYSFVEVGPTERRYSILQWAGSGLTRWAMNGCCSDLEFAINATKAEHEHREELRRAAHNDAIESFPVEDDLPECALELPFFGKHPDAPVVKDGAA